MFRRQVITADAKQVTFKEEARQKLVNGINAVSDAVKVCVPASLSIKLAARAGRLKIVVLAAVVVVAAAVGSTAPVAVDCVRD